MAEDKGDHTTEFGSDAQGRDGKLTETHNTEDYHGNREDSSLGEMDSSLDAGPDKPSKAFDGPSNGELPGSEDDDSEISCEEVEREYDARENIPSNESKVPTTEAHSDEEIEFRDRNYGEESVRVSPYKYQPELVPPFMQWIMERCVKTCDEWANSPHVLKLRETDLPATGRNSKNVQDEFSTSQEEDATYEMASILFEPLLGIVKTTSSGTVWFTKSVVRLQTPTIPFPHMTASFQKSVVQHFAKTLDVDLMTLCQDDLQDLADFLGGKDTSQVSGFQDWPFLFKEPKSAFTRSYSSDSTSSRRSSVSDLVNQDAQPTVDGLSADDVDSKRKARSMQMTFHQPFFEVLLFPRIKRSAVLNASKESTERPLIVHLMPNHEDFDDALLRTLKKSSAWRIGSTSVLFIISTQNNARIEKPPGPYRQHGVNACPCHSAVESMAAVPVAPVRSATQEALMARDGRLEVRSRNVRALKRAIRRGFPQHLTVSLLDPFDEWAFLDATLEVAELFEKAPLPPVTFNGVLQILGDNLSADRLIGAVVNIKVRERALEGWEGWKGPESATEVSEQDQDSSSSSPKSKWDSLPPNIQKTVREIQSATPKNVNDRYYWESMFLDLVVDPGTVEKGWSDIAIDPQVEKEVREVVWQHTNAALGAKSKSYGVLKQSHIGGALLYGPPGTGKTQLARVLACESGQVVICATAADIENKWAGEMPKAIRGLFNLGKLLAPSIIFIDEADSLFSARNSAYNMPWRRQNVNMMLSEMDGLLKSPKTPFVLLSTNLPGDLDPAVLRRVPSHLYLGLPSREMRAKIFEIVLRDEFLHSDISYELLALMTHGYSGSDIRTACIQAAMICNSCAETEGGETKRLLTRDVFEKALRRTRPSVNKLAIAFIQSFAVENDPAALVKMQEFEKDEALIKGLWTEINNRVNENWNTEQQIECR